MDFTTEADLLNGKTIGVLYGGPSAEREVSLQSGNNVAEALEAAGHDVKRIELPGRFDYAAACEFDIDVAFLALHGEFGEDGQAQFILGQAGIPYTGSGTDASALAFDKVLAKRAYEKFGVPTPVWMSFDRDELERMGGARRLDLTPPFVVKPAASGSSLGVTIVKDVREVDSALELALRFGGTALVERYLPGREFTVAVLGRKALPVIELLPEAEFFDYNAKYVADTRVDCPAQLDERTAATLRKIALNAHDALGCTGATRTDMILDTHGMLWVLETNTLPGLTSHSLLPKAAQAAGYTFTQLCEALLVEAVLSAREKRYAA